jgi:hypothetical protein
MFVATEATPGKENDFWKSDPTSYQWSVENPHLPCNAF